MRKSTVKKNTVWIKPKHREINKNGDSKRLLGIHEGEEKVVATTHNHYASPYGHSGHVEQFRYCTFHLYSVLGAGEWKWIVLLHQKPSVF